jgi:hypothetical protein
LERGYVTAHTIDSFAAYALTDEGKRLGIRARA